ncbi:hypothetical protein P153DRAFT_336421 [Dothidotthia symphoricarpi CBS 119687]|uniref:DNA-directed RNA polymerase I subunit RPA43 n=1 Tax=Dothidotthia symphoricarpi CBS 119687 TaxID=1392245 RepID=A0A6A6AJ10_9PLEO|nr:uncharacterized protein P153DRAFT_336421 [Dothidotthia symphoricarpi CBS 119687]KAF2131790.1 hypothetical protein P153DRAFT_336421 [Dothidotthia symphoricarpi CBS 119687]
MAPIQAQDEDASLLHIERISQYVSLSPASLATPLPSLCACIFSPLLLSYFPPAKGIVLAYEDVSLSSSPPSKTTPTNDNDPPLLLLKHIDEYTAPFLWATASFLVFRPRTGARVPARITHQSRTHITLAHLNTFPISVLKDCLPAEWVWEQTEQGRVSKGWDGRIADEGGRWVDGEGTPVEGEMRVWIRGVEGRMDGRGKGKGFLRLEGSLVKDGDVRGKGKKGKGREVLAGDQVELVG